MIDDLVRGLGMALCLGAIASCTVHRAPALPVAEPEALGLSSAALDHIDPSLQAFVDSGAVGGVYAVIARHGRIGYERTFGWRDVARQEPLRRDAVFRIYSMTKPVIAVGILRLVDDGRVRLDDPVSTYIPAFADVKVFAGGTAAAPILEDPDSPITVRQLLNHTAGLAYGLTTGPVDTIFTAAKLYDATRTLEEFTDALARIPLLFHPGTRWSYGSGLDVAGRVIEVASGRTLDRFLDEEIFGPLGMRDTGFRIRPDMRGRLVTVYARGPDGALRALGSDGLMAMFEPGARFLWGSGGLLSTPDDFLRFAQMLANGGAFDGTRILRPETVALMTRNTLSPGMGPISSSSLRDPAYGFGLGVAVKVDTAGATRPGPVGIFRWSGYIGTYFWVDPANDLIAMVWTQFSPGARYPLEVVFEELVYSALATSLSSFRRCGRVRPAQSSGAGYENVLLFVHHGLPATAPSDYLKVMNGHEEQGVGIAELKARLSAYLRRARRGEAVTVYDRDTPVARLVPYEGWLQASLPVRKATAALRDVELPSPLGRDVGSLEALAEERQAGR